MVDASAQEASFSTRVVPWDKVFYLCGPLRGSIAAKSQRAAASSLCRYGNWERFLKEGLWERGRGGDLEHVCIIMAGGAVRVAGGK